MEKKQEKRKKYKKRRRRRGKGRGRAASCKSSGTTGWNTWGRRTRERAKLSEIVRAITSMKYLQQGWDSRRNFETEPRNFSNLETFFE